MNRYNRNFVKKYKGNARWYRKLRHMGDMYAKAMRKGIEVEKSKHNLLYTSACAESRKNHPSWYINGNSFEAST